jgi:hypothetical protein
MNQTESTRDLPQPSTRVHSFTFSPFFSLLIFFRSFPNKRSRDYYMRMHFTAKPGDEVFCLITAAHVRSSVEAWWFVSGGRNSWFCSIAHHHAEDGYFCQQIKMTKKREGKYVENLVSMNGFLCLGNNHATNQVGGDPYYWSLHCSAIEPLEQYNLYSCTFTTMFTDEHSPLVWSSPSRSSKKRKRE